MLQMLIFMWVPLRFNWRSMILSRFNLVPTKGGPGIHTEQTFVQSKRTGVYNAVWINFTTWLHLRSKTKSVKCLWAGMFVFIFLSVWLSEAKGSNSEEYHQASTTLQVVWNLSFPKIPCTAGCQAPRWQVSHGSSQAAETGKLHFAQSHTLSTDPNSYFRITLVIWRWGAG